MSKPRTVFSRDININTVKASIVMDQTQGHGPKHETKRFSIDSLRGVVRYAAPTPFSLTFALVADKEEYSFAQVEPKNLKQPVQYHFRARIVYNISSTCYS